jgi:thioredoxin-related protein
MRSIFILLVWIGVIFSSFSQNINITSFYEGPFEDVLNEAKRLKKPIFMDFTSNTCKHCIKMEKEILANPTIADNLNNNFIGYKVDLEDKEGKALVKKYQIEDFPAYLILDYNLQNKGTIKGFYLAKQFIKEINKMMLVESASISPKQKKGLFRKD